jgi:succinyl-diaminopimelate desuccinylase
LKKLSVKIDKVLEHRAKELTQLCCQLVRVKSENPPGDVTEVAHVIENFLNAEGINYQTFEPSKGHVSIKATLGQGEPSLILCGHIDVVPAGDLSKWDANPYEGLIKHGKILGRGTTDQKGGVAAMLMAIAALKDLEENLNGKVTVASVSDEEAPGPGGARWLLKNKELNGNACIITEPTGHLDDKYSIVGGERGNCWLRITAYGKPAHGSTPALGKNAIHILTEFLSKLKVLESTGVRIPKDAEMLIQNGRKQLQKTAERQNVPGGSLTRVLNHYTANVGVINGGTKVNMVPEKCAAEVDIRVPAGGNPDAVEEIVRCIMPENFECEVINKASPSFTAATHPLTKAVQWSAKRVLGYRPTATYMAYTSDAHYFREILGVPTVSFGPGYSELAHAYNEYVYVKDVLNMAKVYADVIVNLST